MIVSLNQMALFEPVNPESSPPLILKVETILHSNPSNPRFLPFFPFSHFPPFFLPFSSSHSGELSHSRSPSTQPTSNQQSQGPSPTNRFRCQFLVKQYLIERRAVMPHAVTLVGFFRERKEDEDDDDDNEEEEKLARTVEVCFDKRGTNASPPTPTPPKNSPYTCNMTVKE